MGACSPRIVFASFFSQMMTRAALFAVQLSLYMVLLISDTLAFLLPYSTGGVIGSFSYAQPPRAFVYLLGPIFFFRFQLAGGILLAAAGLCGASALSLLLGYVFGTPIARVQRALLSCGLGARIAQGLVTFFAVTTQPALWGGDLGGAFIAIAGGAATNLALLSMSLHSQHPPPPLVVPVWELQVLPAPPPRQPQTAPSRAAGPPPSAPPRKIAAGWGG